ncbi:cytochrome c biogenesis CcdA family protein [Pelomicrobium sp.]|jgi:cytochrome c-type biogenesis protein|uniref:cytochrome c biogenesis CcdA family protein n=1 Tax=Pelomicrobium sp. TaxID=2815319 RepID=UPI002FDE7380
MDVESLRQTLEQANLASLAAGFVIGFLFSFNPVALAAIPVSLAYVTKARAPGQAVAYGGMFILGMLATHLALGLAAGLGGGGLQRLMGREWGLVLGPLLILLGLLWPGWLRLPLPTISLRAKRAATAWGAFALGAPFSVAICPFCTPALVILLGIAAGIGSAWFGAVLLLAFALGRAVPIILGACAVGWLESLKTLSIHQKAFEIAGGVLLIAAGLYMLNAYWMIVPALAL